MLTAASHFKGLSILATDGELGTVDDLYFDDEGWAIRYLVVDTGNWLSGRQVLISPMSVISVDWETKRLLVSLTKSQVEKSPATDTHKPVFRQHEAAYLDYYSYPYYWGGPYLWGPALFPSSIPVGVGESMQSLPQQSAGAEADTHLRSIHEVASYYIEAADGEIGHVDGFLVDDQTWSIRYLEVATKNWWPGKRILVAPAWIVRVSWSDSKVYLGLSRETIKNAPEYDDSKPVTRDYEDKLFLHYGRPSYWSSDAAHSAYLTSRGD